MEPDVVVVTGAAKGMGMAAARRLARPDRILVLVDVDAEGLAATCKDLTNYAGRDAVQTAEVDVSDAAAVRDLAARVTSLGSLAVLAHAAGISPTMADWRTVIRVDFVGTAILLDEFLPLAEPGTVGVCWSSGAAYIGAAARGDEAIDGVMEEPRAHDLLDRLELVNGKSFNAADGSDAAYRWAKRGVIRLVRRRAAAWGKRGARLVAVSPGIIDTPMSRFEYDTRSYMRELVAGGPVPRMGTASEVAELVAFLVSPNASFITGTDIAIDGGCFSAGLH